MSEAIIFWRRLDLPGHEICRLVAGKEQQHLFGTALFSLEGQPCELRYNIVCDGAWRTVSATVKGSTGNQPVDIRLHVDAKHHWRWNDVLQPQVEGCLDIDLAFSPATNTLPIRRLNLEVGAEAPVSAAWLTFPELTLEPLHQVYRRLAERRWQYGSHDGTFSRELEVDDQGLVKSYPGLWEAER